MDKITPYPSTKAALGAAASLSRQLGYPTVSTAPRVQSVPDGEALDRPIAVRAALTQAGIEPDSEDAELLYAWATTADGRDEWDEALEGARGERDYQEQLRRGQAARARLGALLEVVEAALVEHGVVRRLPKPKVHRLGWRVVEDDEGARNTQVVVDPSPDDPTVYTGPDGEREAKRVARGEAEGHVVAHTVLVSGRKHPGLAAELGPRWDAGEFEALCDLDDEIADRLSCSTRHARRVRRSWGIEGSRGAAPTRPPNYCAAIISEGWSEA